MHRTFCQKDGTHGLTTAPHMRLHLRGRRCEHMMARFRQRSGGLGPPDHSRPRIAQLQTPTGRFGGWRRELQTQMVAGCVREVLLDPEVAFRGLNAGVAQ